MNERCFLLLLGTPPPHPHIHIHTVTLASCPAKQSLFVRITVVVGGLGILNLLGAERVALPQVDGRSAAALLWPLSEQLSFYPSDLGHGPASSTCWSMTTKAAALAVHAGQV